MSCIVNQKILMIGVEGRGRLLVWGAGELSAVIEVVCVLMGVAVSQVYVIKTSPHWTPKMYAFYFI